MPWGTPTDVRYASCRWMRRFPGNHDCVGMKLVLVCLHKIHVTELESSQLRRDVAGLLLRLALACYLGILVRGFDQV